MKILFVRPNKNAFGYKPIGLAILSSIAKQLGWESKLFDTTEFDFHINGDTNISLAEAKIFKPVDFEKYNMTKKDLDLKKELMKVLQEYDPDLMAFSVLSDQRFIAHDIAKIGKEYNKNLPMLWGGIYSTLNPEQLLKMSIVDYVCLGEGFEPLKDFLIAMEKNEPLDNIPNIWTKKNGKIIKNKLRPLMRNLDELPYVDWEIFDIRQIYKAFDGNIVMGGDHMINWGCPYHCLVEDTKIITKNGNDLIQNIKIGDVIKGFDTKDQLSQPTKVTKLYKRKDIIYNVILEDKTELNITGEHPVYTKRGWVKVRELKEEDEVLRN